MKYRSCLLICASMMLSIVTGAQNSDHPLKLSFGTTAVDYNSELSYFTDLFGATGDWNRSRAVNRVVFGRSLTPSFSVEGVLSAMTLSTMPNVNPTKGNWWIDIDATLNYHFANGYILSEHSCIDPYLFAGAGLDMLEHRNNKANADEEAGVVWDKHAAPKIGFGADYWFMEQFGIFVQTVYAFMGGEGMDYAQHSIGFVMRFGKGEDLDQDGIANWEDMCPDKTGLRINNGCPDADGDGIIDGNDVCPYAAGLQDLRGCPDSDNDGIPDKDDGCPTEKGTAALNGCPK